MTGMPLAAAVAAPVNLNGPGHYVGWGIFHFSVANVVMIAVIVLAFVGALLLPFPKGRDRG